jgi:hypothetical protein
LKNRQASKVDDTASLLCHHPGENGLEQEEGPCQLRLNLPLPHRNGHGTKRVGWQQTAKGLLQTSSDGEETYRLRDPMSRSLERLKWFLWHRNVYQALQVIQSAEMDIEAAVAVTRETTAQQPLKVVNKASDAHAGPHRGTL